MGITGLLQALKSVTKEIHVNEYSNMRVCAQRQLFVARIFTCRIFCADPAASHDEQTQIADNVAGRD